MRTCQTPPPCPTSISRGTDHSGTYVLDWFPIVRLPCGMPDAPPLRPATTDEIMSALSFALQFQGRKRVHHADDIMAKITAERLVKHLEASGFVLMKRPPADAPTTSHMPPSPR
jgi:hypothetical protein